MQTIMITAFLWEACRQRRGDAAEKLRKKEEDKANKAKGGGRGGPPDEGQAETVPLSRCACLCSLCTLR